MKCFLISVRAEAESGRVGLSGFGVYMGGNSPMTSGSAKRKASVPAIVPSSIGIRVRGSLLGSAPELSNKFSKSLVSVWKKSTLCWPQLT